mgnify:CR=1 FL=1
MAGEAEDIRPKGLLLLFTSFKLLNILPDAEFRHVINAMKGYVESGTEPEGLSDIEQLAFESQPKAMEYNIVFCRHTVLVNRENGRKGGRPRKPKETDGFSKETEKTDGFSEKPIATHGEPMETHSPPILKIKDYTDTNVSDISTTTVVVKPESVDKDLARIANHIQEVFGDFPPSVGYKLKSWLDVFSADMILLAIDRAAEAGKRNWTYVDGTLRGWKRDGIKNPAGVAASDEQWQNRQQQGNRAGNARKPAEDVGSQLDRVLAKMDKERGFEP